MNHRAHSSSLQLAVTRDTVDTGGVRRPLPVMKAPPPFAYRLAVRVGAALDRMRLRAMPAAPALMDLTATGIATVACLGVVADLAIADRLKTGPRQIADLAAEAQCDRDALRRVLRLLSSRGVFHVDGDRVELTRIAEPLRSDHHQSMHAWVRMICAPLSWQRLGDLTSCVQSGSDSYRLRDGVGFFDWLARHPDQAELFDAGMSSASELDNTAIAAGYDFSEIKRLADLAGGRGSTLAAILGKYPTVRGTLVDRPEVLARAKVESKLNDAELRERVEFVEGDIFAAVPSGQDAYMMKSVIHDWDDEAALCILSTCRRAMAPGARLLLAEMVVAPDDEPHPGKVLDVAMLALTGGQERSAAEYGRLLQKAGLALQRIVPTASPTSLIEARAA